MPPVLEEKIAEGFKAAGERMHSHEQSIEEIKACLEILTAQFKRYGTALVTGTLDGKDHKGFWPNESMAKEFGQSVMSIIGARGKSMTTTGEGGAMVPTTLANFIIQKMGRYGKFRRNAVLAPIGGGSMIVPKVTADLTIYCPGESNLIQTSDVYIAQVVLLAKKFACLAVLSRELEEDSLAGLGEIVGISIARSMAKKEDEIAFMGDGTSEYFGMTGVVGKLRAVDATIGNIKSLIVGSGNAYSELTLEDFRKVVGILPEDADDNAKWYMSKKFFYNVVYPLAETAGDAGIFEILSNRKDRFLLGYPVEFVGCMPSTAGDSQICAVLADLELGAILGERRILEIARSEDYLFGNDMTAIRGTERIDINCHGVGNTEEAGPIVGLITAAA